MKILLSPAKMLDCQKVINTPFYTVPEFLKEAAFLVRKLQKYSPKELSKLMRISLNLSEINYERFRNWEMPATLSETTRPSVTVFNGEVYKGLNVANFTKKEFETAQEKIRILSGLYGVLKPLDLMYPYRLEMGTKWKINEKTPNLYSFWKSTLSNFFNNDLQKEEVIINLASNEYSKVIDKKKIKNRIITPVFKELRGDTFKVIMVYAKHARGAMARELLSNKYKKIEDLKSYNKDSYSYNEKLSSDNEWVFVR